MKSRSEAEQILERNTSDGSPRLRQDKEERKEKRSNSTALVLLLITIAVLAYAAYTWYNTAYPVQVNSTVPVNTTLNNTPTPAANPPVDQNTRSE